jgi:ribosome biogenesis GTPase / thiamine phosphate phosphatase
VLAPYNPPLSKRRHQHPEEPDTADSHGHENSLRFERLDGGDKRRRKQKMRETADLRADAVAEDAARLPLGRVVQVFSIYQEVEMPDGGRVQCTARRTLYRLRDAAPVVGDLVRVREQPSLSLDAKREGVIEAVSPRRTVLTRADSFKGMSSHPIVANADQMLIVVSVAEPRPKWGLVDRMLVAARAGGLAAIICLNKIDLGDSEPQALAEAREVLAHYRTLGLTAEETCATRPGTETVLCNLLRDKKTVLAGHSGVGKSSLVRVVMPSLDIRVGAVSEVNQKGRHTTTSARIYPVPHLSAELIDTPGVKLFGLWGVTEETLVEHYPDVEAGTAPAWRVESLHRIAESLK